jgi:hypothetical protein
VIDPEIRQRLGVHSHPAAQPFKRDMLITQPRNLAAAGASRNPRVRRSVTRSPVHCLDGRKQRRQIEPLDETPKLIIAGNHKPGLRSVNEAIRRRFHLVPFTVTIPPEERDKDLADKLKAEWPGIPRMPATRPRPAGGGDRGDRRLP